MNITNSSIAVFGDHAAAETAIKKLSAAGFDIKQLSVLGKGYHTEEKVVGFYNLGERMKFWGIRGAFWGGLWGLFFGGLFVTLPFMGPVVVLGYLAATAVSGLEGAVALGGLGMLAAALCNIGVPRDSAIAYETSVKEDGFLVMVHGTEEEAERAKVLLASEHPKSVDTHIHIAEAA